DKGTVIWSKNFPKDYGAPIPVWGFAANALLDGDKLICLVGGKGSTVVAFDCKNDGKELWKSLSLTGGAQIGYAPPMIYQVGKAPTQTEGLHAIMCTPVVKDGYIYGVCSYGQLRCLKLDTGERVWEDLRATGRAKEPTERWANAFIVPHGDRYFLFNEKGDLIIAKLTPKGYEEIDRAHLLDPTGQLGGGY